MMKNLIITLGIGLTIALASCGGDGEDEARKVDTADVKGTIEAPDAKGDHVSHTHNDEGEFECSIIKFDDDNRISICPTQKTIDDIYKDLNENPERINTTRTILDVGEDYIFIKQVNKSFKDEIEADGWNFFVIKKNPKGGNYILEGEGDTPFDPILDEARAKELMKIAQTFKGAE